MARQSTKTEAPAAKSTEATAPAPVKNTPPKSFRDDLAIALAGTGIDPVQAAAEIIAARRDDDNGVVVVVTRDGKKLSLPIHPVLAAIAQPAIAQPASDVPAGEVPVIAAPSSDAQPAPAQGADEGVAP